MDQERATRYNQLTTGGVMPASADNLYQRPSQDPPQSSGMNPMIPMSGVPVIGSARPQAPQPEASSIVQCLGVLWQFAQENKAVEPELAQAAGFIIQALQKIGVSLQDENSYNTLA